VISFEQIQQKTITDKNTLRACLKVVH